MPDPITETTNQNPSTCLKLDENASLMDLTDGINECLGKAAAIVGTLTGNDNFKLMNDDAVSDAFWTIGSLVAEIQAMSSRTYELRSEAEGCGIAMNRRIASRLNPFIDCTDQDETSNLVMRGLLALEDYQFGIECAPNKDATWGFSLLLQTMRLALEYERDSSRVSETGNQG